MGGATRAAFLDRDGVLVDVTVVDGVPHPVPSGPLLPGVAEACAALRDAGFRLVLVTNQPDIARGTVARDDVEHENRVLADLLELDDVRMCPHDDADACGCRKPAPGMLTAAAADLGLDLAASVTIGDRWRDVEAGIAAGTRTVFVDRGYGERTPTHYDWRAPSLPAAVALVLDPAAW